MSDILCIQGGVRLCGEVSVSGGKNAAVAIIPAALLAHMFEGRIQRLFRELDEFILTLLPQLERFEGRLRGNHETIDVAEYPRNPIAREAVEPARRSPDPVKKP